MMQRILLLVALGLVDEASAARFAYVTPSDLQERKVTETPVNQANFVRLAPDITTYAPTEAVQPVLLESLRRMGAELLKRVAFDPADTPSGLRVRAGFAACVSGEWDGAYLVGMDKLARDQVKKDLSSRNLMTEPEEDQISLDE